MWSSKLNDTRLFRSKQLLLMFTDCTVLVMHHKFWSIPIITHVMPIARHAWDLGKLQMTWKVLSISAAIWCKGLDKNFKKHIIIWPLGLRNNYVQETLVLPRKSGGVQLYIVQWTISGHHTDQLQCHQFASGTKNYWRIITSNNYGWKKTTISNHQPKISNVYIYIIIIIYIYIYTIFIFIIYIYTYYGMTPHSPTIFLPSLGAAVAPKRRLLHFGVRQGIDVGRGFIQQHHRRLVWKKAGVPLLEGPSHGSHGP